MALKIADPESPDDKSKAAALNKEIEGQGLEDGQTTPSEDVAKESGVANEDDYLRINPLMSSANNIDNPFTIKDSVGEETEVAGLGSVFTKALKKNVEDAVIPAYEISEKAALRTEEFIERNKLDIELPDKAVNINFEYLDAPEKINQVIEDTSQMFGEQIQKSRRGTQSHDQTKLLAGELGMTTEELMARPIGEAWNAEKITAARYMLASARDKVGELAEKIKTGQASEEDMVEFRATFSKYAAIQNQLHGIAAEAGRALNAFRIVAKSGELRRAEVENLMSRSGGDIKRLAEGFAMLDDPIKQAKFARDANKASGLDMVLEFWINSLLSSPKTHMVNMTSNLLVAAMQVPERALAGGWGKILGSGVDGIQAGEVGAQIFGFYRGSIDGLKAFGTVLKTGEPLDPAAKVEAKNYNAITGENIQALAKRNKNRLKGLVGKGVTPDDLDAMDGTPGGAVARGIDYIGAVVRTPGRFLMAEDELFKSIGYRMELNAQAYRDSVKRGLTGEEQAAHIADIMNNPPENIHVAAVNAAKYQTFTNELGPAGKAFQSTLAAFPVARFIVPFVRTPINILKYSTERMFPPLPFVDTRLKDDLFSGDPARRDMALGKLSAGAMAWGTISAFVAEDYDCSDDFCITGGRHPDPGIAAAYKRSGWQPYSIKIGDEWFSYSRLDPIGQMLGIVADSNRVLASLNSDDEKAFDEFAVGLVMSVSNNLTNKTYMRGVAEFLDAVESRNLETFKRYYRRFGTSFIPSLVGAVEQQVDPTWRDSRTLVDAWCAKTPGCSKDLKPVYDLWGFPQDTGYLGVDIVSPIMMSKDKQKPIDKELIRLKFSPKRVSRRVMGVEMKPEEHGYYERLAGHSLKAPDGMVVGDVDISGLGLRDALSKLVRESKEYKSLSDYETAIKGTKKRYIRDVVKAYRDMAQLALFDKYPDLLNLIIEKKVEDAVGLGADPAEAEDAAEDGRQSYLVEIENLMDEIKIVGEK